MVRILHAIYTIIPESLPKDFSHITAHTFTGSLFFLISLFCRPTLIEILNGRCLWRFSFASFNQLSFLSVSSSDEEVLSLSLLTRVYTLTGILDFCFSWGRCILSSLISKRKEKLNCIFFLQLYEVLILFCVCKYSPSILLRKCHSSLAPNAKKPPNLSWAAMVP